MKKKIPLWSLLPVLVILLLGGIQIGADVRLHSDQRANFIQNAWDNAANAESALNLIVSEERKTESLEEVYGALTQAVFCSEYLSNVFWTAPEHTILGKRKCLSDGINSPITVFAYAKSELEEIRRNYDLSEEFLADDYSVLRQYRDAYGALAEGLSQGNKMSDEQLAECFNAFAKAVYPHS